MPVCPRRLVTTILLSILAFNIGLSELDVLEVGPTCNDGVPIGEGVRGEHRAGVGSACSCCDQLVEARQSFRPLVDCGVVPAEPVVSSLSSFYNTPSNVPIVHCHPLTSIVIH